MSIHRGALQCPRDDARRTLHPSAYTVLIDEQPFDGEQVRLTDRNGRRVGDFSVQRIEPLEAVCQIRLWI